MNLMHSNVVIALVSIASFLIVTSRSSEQWAWQTSGFVIGIGLLFVGEALAEKWALTKKFSVITFCHEGAHWLVLKALKRQPNWIVGELKVSYSSSEMGCADWSLATLAPLIVWWFGLLIWAFFGSSTYVWISGISAITLVVATTAGMPSAYAMTVGESDWELAQANGCKYLNYALNFVGPVICFFMWILHRNG